MNFKQLYTQAGNTALVNDTTIAKQAVNDAIREIIAECAWNFKKAPAFALTSGVWEYPMASVVPGVAVLKIQYLMYQPLGASITNCGMLENITVQELIESQYTSAGTVGISGGCYAIGDLSTLMLYPSPSLGDNIILYYSSDIADYTDDTAVIAEVPPHLHRAIVYIAARNLAIVNNAQMVSELEPLAQLGLATCRNFSNTRKTRRSKRVRVGSHSSRGAARNDQYYSGDY